MGIQLEFDPAELVKEVVDDHKLECERIALEVFEGIVDRTPVFTGRLRASWKISHTVPDETLDPSLERARVAHYSRGGGEEHQDQESGFEQSTIEPPAIPTHLEGLPDNPTIFITNMQPYAEYVNDGSPKNKPVHMVELALAAVKG
jgi:hypothetical protein